MKKSTAGLGLVAAAGLAALAASPAVAAPIVFENCPQAETFGVFNIPADAPGYGVHLDRDVDGIGCESDTVAYNPALVPDDGVVTPTPTPTPVPTQSVPTTPETPQIEHMPVGGADTGVTQETGNDAGILALGGGLVLAAAAGGVLVVRRRASQA